MLQFLPTSLHPFLIHRHSNPCQTLTDQRNLHSGSPGVPNWSFLMCRGVLHFHLRVPNQFHLMMVVKVLYATSIHLNFHPTHKMVKVGRAQTSMNFDFHPIHMMVNVGRARTSMHPAFDFHPNYMMVMLEELVPLSCRHLANWIDLKHIFHGFKKIPSLNSFASA